MTGRLALGFGGWLAGLGLALALVWDVDLRAAARLLGELDGGGLVTFAALSVATHVVLIGRPAVLLRAAGYRVRAGALLKQRLSSFAVAYLTPGPQVGGEPVQVILLRREGVALADALAATFIERLVEVVVNALVLSGGAVYLAARGLLPVGAVPVVVILCALVVAVVALYGLGLRPLAGLARLRVPQLLALREALADGEVRALALVSRRRGALAAAAFVAVGAWGLAALETALVLGLVGIDATGPRTAVVLVLVRTSILLPLPAGLGAFEAAHVVALRLTGADSGAALAMAVLVRARDLAAALLGLTWWAAGGRGPKSLVPAALAPTRQPEQARGTGGA